MKTTSVLVYRSSPPSPNISQYSNFIRHLDASKYHVDLLNFSKVGNIWLCKANVFANYAVGVFEESGLSDN